MALQIGVNPPIPIATTTTTDADGFYTFGGLRPTRAGELYVVTVVPPAGVLQTYDLMPPLDDAAGPLDGPERQRMKRE